MLQSPAPRVRQRAVAAALAVAIVGILLWLGAHPMRFPRLASGPGLATFDVPPQAPPPLVAGGRATGRPAPPGRRPTRTIIVVDVPDPVPSPAADSGVGTATTAGEGNGAGGTGTGSGGGGTGGLGWAIALHARKVAGEITDRDYPKAARKTRLTGTVEAAFTVTPSGAVIDCTVARSSGVPELDETTCRLIQARFRYEPARDLSGNPVAEPRGWRQRWWLERGRDAAPD